jgi:hypothetical protein
LTKQAHHVPHQNMQQQPGYQSVHHVLLIHFQLELEVQLPIIAVSQRRLVCPLQIVIYLSKNLNSM